MLAGELVDPVPSYKRGRAHLTAASARDQDAVAVQGLHREHRVRGTMWGPVPGRRGAHHQRGKLGLTVELQQQLIIIICELPIVQVADERGGEAIGERWAISLAPVMTGVLARERQTGQTGF